MNGITRGQITAIYRDDNYAVVTVDKYGSVTFSLTSWEDPYPPEVGDQVILKSITKRERGWRAKAACPITLETETTLLPEEYPDTVMGRIFQKWDRVFYLSVVNEDWERLIKRYNPTAQDLVYLLAGGSGSFDRPVDERIKARIFLLLLGMIINDVPFSLPSRSLAFSFIGAEDAPNPFSSYNSHNVFNRRSVNTLEVVSDQMLEFIVDVVVENLADVPNEFTGDNYQAEHSKLHWQKLYFNLFPQLVSVLEKRLPEKAIVLVDMYDLDLFYKEYSNEKPFVEMLASANNFSTIAILLDRMEHRIRKAKHHNFGEWKRTLAEYVSATSPGGQSSWRDPILMRALSFMIEQQASYELFNLKLIDDMLLYSWRHNADRWSDEEKREMLTLITDYVIVQNSSWIVFGKYPDNQAYKLTKWVLENTHPEDTRLQEQIKAYKSE
jgi:hypothetical protein